MNQHFLRGDNSTLNPERKRSINFNSYKEDEVTLSYSFASIFKRYRKSCYEKLASPIVLLVRKFSITDPPIGEINLYWMFLYHILLITHDDYSSILLHLTSAKFCAISHVFVALCFSYCSFHGRCSSFTILFEKTLFPLSSFVAL